MDDSSVILDRERRKLMKQMAAGTTAVALGSAAGCLTGGGGGEQKVKIPDNPDKAVKGQEIVHAMDAGHNTRPFKWFQDEIKQETGVGLKKIQGFPFSGLFDKLMTEFTSGSSAFDLVSYYPQFLGTFAANGHLQPLDEMMKIDGWDPNFDGVLAPFRKMYTQWGGKTYALPIDGDVHMLVYRRDLFEKHGKSVPKTWKEFNEVARYFTEETDDIEYGVATYGKRGFCYGWFLDRFGGAGGVYFDKDMNPQINTEAGKRALKNWKETIKHSPPETTSYGYAGLRDAFIKGKVAMVIQWTDVPKKAAASDVTKGKWGGAPVPGWSDGGAASAMPVGRVLSIPAYVSNTKKLAAYRFAQTFTKNKFSKHMVSDPDCGEDPFRKGHFTNPEVYTQPNKFRDGQPKSSIAFSSLESAKQYTSGVQKTLEQGYPEPYWPGAQQYINALDIQMSKFVSGQIGAEKALSNVEKEWNAIVEELGKEEQKKHYQKVIEAWKDAGIWKQ